MSGLEQQGQTGDEIEIRKAGSRKAPRQRKKSPTDKRKGGGNNRVVRKNIRRMVRQKDHRQQERKEMEKKLGSQRGTTETKGRSKRGENQDMLGRRTKRR